jgi:SAM-dependent methyltransferase
VLKTLSQKYLPSSLRQWLLKGYLFIIRVLTLRPPVGWVDFGNLRRLRPISRHWGFDRGQPIDRYYIEQFLSTHRSDVRGHVLEIAGDTYARKFGGGDGEQQVSRVEKVDVLHVTKDNPRASIVADLTCADHIPSNTFDCIILTQTLHLIYDLRAALKHLYRILKPDGVLLVTVPGISQISSYDIKRWGDCWRFTTCSVRRLFEEFFLPENVSVKAYGNVLAAVAFLHGLAVEELKTDELEYNDPEYELVITVRAVKDKGHKKFDTIADS